MQDIAYFRLQAAYCRQLAVSLSNGADPTAVGLLRMADEFDAHADALETRIVRKAAPPSRDEEAPRLHCR